MKNGFSPLAWAFILLGSAAADYALLYLWRQRRLHREPPWAQARPAVVRAWRRTRPALPWGGLGLMLWAAFTASPEGASRGWGLALATLGWLAALAALRPEEVPAAPAARPLRLPPAARRLLGAGGALSLLAAATVSETPRLPHPWLTISAWGAGIALVIAGAWRAEAARKPRTGERRGTLLWTAAALAGAAFLPRAWHLAQVPPMLTGDEAHFGFGSLALLCGVRTNIFLPNTFGYPSLFEVSLTPFIVLGGRNIPALRLFPALVGALTVGAVYLMGQALFGRKAALWAAIFLAGFDFHIHFSRLALSNVVDGLSFVLVLGALWHAERTRRPASFLLAGLLTGLGLYFYASARLLPVLIPAWLLLRHLQAGGRRPFPWRGLGLTALAAVVVLLPAVWLNWRAPGLYQGSVQRASILGPWMEREQALTGDSVAQILIRQAEAAVSAYTRRPPAVFYASNTPLLRFAAQAFFLLGIGLLLREPRDERLSLLALWLAAITAAGALSVSPPSVQRYVAAAPALALFIGYAVERMRREALSLRRVPPLLATLLATALVGGMAFEGVHFYFGEYAPRSYLGGDHTYLAQQAADHLRGKPASWEAVFIGTRNMKYTSIAALPFLAGHIRGTTWLYPWGDSRNPAPRADSVVFIVLEERPEALPHLSSACPSGALHPVFSPDERVLGWIYDCPSYRWPLTQPSAGREMR